MSPFKAIRMFLFGGTPRHSLSADCNEQLQHPEPSLMARGPQTTPPAVQPRRLTHVFFNLEPDTTMPVTIPRFDKISYDTVEYYCYVLLHQTSRDSALEYCEELEQCLRSTEEIHDYGRLTCRVFLVALSQDICCASPNSDDDTTVSLLDLSHDKWVELKDRLVLIRKMLLRKDADLYVPLGGDQEKLPPSNCDVDENKVNLPMFGELYEDLLQKFLVQMAIAKFRESLSAISQDVDQHQTFLKRIEESVDEFKAALTKEVFKHDEVPAPLTSFLLQDLYQSNREEISVLPLKLKKDIEMVLLDDTQPYSYRMLQNDVRIMMKRWHSTLSTPELVRLGYGGIRESANDDDNRSVSSWGADEQLTDEKLLTQPRPGTTSEADESSDDEDEGDSPKTVEVEMANIEPLPHGNEVEQIVALREEEPNVALREEVILENEIQRAESCDDTEPVLRREDSRPIEDDTNQEEIPSVTPSRSTSRKRKVSLENGVLRLTKRRSRNEPLRLEGFASSDDDDEDDDFLSETPSVNRKYIIRRVVRSSPKRNFFTDEETKAIQEGVKRFGAGNWTLIKWNSNGRLKDRSTVQIKDKYRNMIQKGQI